MHLNDSRAGFTLTELLVVVGIIVLVSLVTIPAMTPFLRGQRLRSGARTVQSAILMARTQAIRRRAIYQVEFDQQNQEMRISDTDGLPSSVFGKDVKLPDTISFSEAVTTILFSPMGYATAGPDTSHPIKLKDASGRELQLVFHRTTGQVRRPR